MIQKPKIQLKHPFDKCLLFYPEVDGFVGMMMLQVKRIDGQRCGQHSPVADPVQQTGYEYT